MKKYVASVFVLMPCLVHAIPAEDDFCIIEHDGPSQYATNDTIGHPFHSAIARGDIVDAYSLLTIRPDVINEQLPNGNTPLYTAAYFNNLIMIQCLLARGANLNIKDNDNPTILDRVRSCTGAYLLNQTLD